VRPRARGANRTRVAGRALIAGLVAAAVFLAPGAGDLVAQTPLHNCSFCHNLHGGDFQALTDYATSEAVCLSCHGDAGPAQVDRDGTLVTVPRQSAVHDGAKHTSPTSCWDCHNHEAEASANLKMIQSSMPTPSSGTKTVLFTARTGTNSFADGDTTYDGVCEVCHTLTDQHRNDGAAGKHNAATDCVSACHSHDSGFQGAGGCTLCHNTSQGTRRAIVPEFNRFTHHVDWSAAGFASPDSIPDSDCTTCHDQSQHQQGSVRLWDVDLPGNTGASTVLTGDPNTSFAEAAKVEAHCTSCHDSDGANGNTTPFSGGATVPALDLTAWAAASHEGTTAIAGCYGNGLIGCHSSGHGSEKASLLGPADVAPTAPNNAEEEEGFCYECHDASGPSGTDLETQFNKGTNTATNTFHHPVVDSEQAGGRAVECTNCHNPHEATSIFKLEGVPGTNLAGQSVTATVEYEVCLECHGDTYRSGVDLDGDGQTDTSNKRLDLATNASAYHPVQQAGRNQSTALQNQLIGGLTTNSTILCADCHNNEQTRNASGAASNSTASPQGPHGSTEYPILRDFYDLSVANSGTTTPSSDVALCVLCHNSADLVSRMSPNNTNFSQGNSNYHARHWDGWADGVTCRTCHYNAHGNQFAPNTIYRIIDGGTTDYTSAPIGYKTRLVSFAPNVSANGAAQPIFQINPNTRQRACGLTCHGMTHDVTDGDIQYTPSATGDDDALTY